jgi:transcriptional regulator with XRE-family HTH domain
MERQTKPEGFGDFIRRARLEKSMTQKELVEKCGIEQGLLSAIERRTTMPNPIILYKLCKALDLNLTNVILSFIEIKQEANNDGTSKKVV